MCREGRTFGEQRSTKWGLPRGFGAKTAAEHPGLVPQIQNSTAARAAGHAVVISASNPFLHSRCRDTTCVGKCMKGPAVWEYEHRHLIMNIGKPLLCVAASRVCEGASRDIPPNSPDSTLGVARMPVEGRVATWDARKDNHCLVVSSPSHTGAWVRIRLAQSYSELHVLSPVGVINRVICNNTVSVEWWLSLDPMLG